MTCGSLGRFGLICTKWAMREYGDHRFVRVSITFKVNFRLIDSVMVANVLLPERGIGVCCECAEVFT